MVAAGDLAGKQQHQVALAHFVPRPGEHALAFDAVRLHDLELIDGVLARLEEDVIRNGDLADIVQRRRLGDLVDVLRRQEVGIARQSAEMFGEQADIGLRPADMVAGALITKFGQRHHDADRGLLQLQHLVDPAIDLSLQPGALILKEGLPDLDLEMRPHPRQNNGRRDRLVDEIDGTEFEAQFLIGSFGFGGEEDHRHAGGRRVRLQCPADRIAIHLGHHHIEQDQIRRRRLGQRQPALPAVGQLDPVMLTQQLVEQTEVGGCVVDDKHRRPVVRHHWPPPL